MKSDDAPADRTESFTATVRWAGLSDTGKVREHNEDSIGVASLSSAQCYPDISENSAIALPETGILFTVCDGVGGQNAGEFASRLGVETFAECCRRGLKQDLDRRNSKRASLLENAAFQTNGAVRQAAAGDPKKEGMATTLSALWLVGDRAYTAQVGDSRVYRWRKGEVRQLTCDQSEIGRQLYQGILSEEEARRAPGRNVIESALGAPPDIFKVDTDWFETQPGDFYILCSDGVSDGVLSSEFAAMISENLSSGASLAALSTQIIDRANEVYGRDNASVIVVQVLAGEDPGKSPSIPMAASASVSKTKPTSRGPLPPYWSIAALVLAFGLGALAIHLLSARPLHREALANQDASAKVIQGLEEALAATQSGQLRLEERSGALENVLDRRNLELAAQRQLLESALSVGNQVRAELSQTKEQLRSKNSEVVRLSGTLEQLSAELRKLQATKAILQQDLQRLEAAAVEQAIADSEEAASSAMPDALIPPEEKELSETKTNNGTESDAAMLMDEDLNEASVN